MEGTPTSKAEPAFGPNNMDTNTRDPEQHQAGDGSFIGLIVVSAPTSINFADQSIGVQGGDST